MEISEMKPIHLRSEELTYELRIRGIVTSKKDAPLRRKMLLRRIETDRGRDLEYIDSEYSFDTEKPIIENTLTELRALIEDFDGPDTDSTFLRIKTRIIHITHRILRIQIPNPDDGKEVENFRNESHATAIELETLLFEKASNFLTIPPVNTSQLSNNSSVGSQILNCSFNHNNSSNKSVPVYKWNLKFSGESNCSLLTFLDKVEELCKARHVSKTELFDSSVDLFSDRAYIWFKSVQNKVNNWDSLVALLKQNFLPPDLEDHIWEEIRSRTQGKDEPIHVYVAIMESLFRRLERPIAEVTKLKYLRKNILPIYAMQLALINVASVEDLIDFCRKIDNAQIVKNKFRPPPKVSNLDPELVYLSSDLATTSNAPSVQAFSTTNTDQFQTNTNKLNSKKGKFNRNKGTQRQPERKFSNNTIKSTVSPMVCWNCQQPNHTFNSCKAKKTKFCFRCGKPNETTKTCSCSKNE